MDNEALKTAGRLFNVLEGQITELESTLHKTQDDLENTQKSLRSVQDRLRPYDDYQAQAQAAVDKLKGLQDRLQSSAKSKLDDDLAKLVHKHEAILQQHNDRPPNHLASAEQAVGQSWATKELARLLIQRLIRGDALDQDTATTLLQAIGEPHANQKTQNPPGPRQQETPVTDTTDDQDDAQRAKQTTKSMADHRVVNNTSTSAKTANKRSADPDVEQSPEATNSSNKRRRLTQDTISATRTSKRRTKSKSVGMPEVESALNSFKRGRFSDKRRKANDSDEDEEDVVATPELRRTPRQHKPAKKHPDMVHWKDANARVKGMRPSGASPRKSIM